MSQVKNEQWENQFNDEVRRNFDAFQELLPEILTEKRGKIALMRDKQIVDYFNTRLQARNAAAAKYPDGSGRSRKSPTKSRIWGPYPDSPAERSALHQPSPLIHHGIAPRRYMRTPLHSPQLQYGPPE